MRLAFVLPWLIGGLGGGLFAAGCSPTGAHELTLLSPVNEPCSKTADPSCQPTYYSCADLSVTSLRLEVGVFDRQVTVVSCPDGLQTGSAKVLVNYQPGADFYMIDASFKRDGDSVYITSGPYPDSQAALPWQVLLR